MQFHNQSVSLRAAKPYDKLDVIPLLRALHEDSGYGSSIPFDLESVKNSYDRLLETDKKNAYVAVVVNEKNAIVGVFGASRMQHLFNSNHWTAIEVAFYVLPEYRNYRTLRLILESYFYWAKVTGCKSVLVGKLKRKYQIEDYKLVVL